MQNLNDRLASYLEKVRCLEKENTELEKKIKDWYASRTVICHDHSAYFATIAGLKDKVRGIGGRVCVLELGVFDT